ncbi:MAG: hypothetical protein ACRD3T_03160 [Terriglobia bacterium]
MSLWFKHDDQPADSRKIMDPPDANPSGSIAARQSAPPGSEKRRTTRLSIAVPVTVSGKDAVGEAFQEETNTLNIDRHGALLALHHQVSAGSELTIENHFLEISVTARVVAFRDRISPADPDHVEIELVESKNVWGIQYPPKDWLRAMQQQRAAQPSSVSRATGQQPSPPPAPAPVPGAALDLPPTVQALRPHTAPAGTPPIEIDLGAFEKQAEQSAEALLKTFGAKLAKLGAQMGTRIQTDLTEAAERVEGKAQKLSALDDRLSSLSQALEGTLARAEAVLTSAGEIGQRSAQETQQREEEFHHQLQQMLGSALQNFDDRINQKVLASSVAQQEQLSRLQQETVESLQEIQGHLRAKAETISKEVVASIPGEIERTRVEAVAQISGQAEEKLNAAIQRFEQRLESLAGQTQETTSERMRVETLAKLTPELEARQTQTINQTQDRVKQTLEAAFGEFEQRLQASATQTQETVSERLKTETLSKLLPELVSRQVDTIEQARERVRQTVEVAVSEFQQRLQATVMQTQEEAAVQLRVNTLAKLTPELEARQAEVINQTQDRAKQSLEAALDEFEQRLQASAAQAQETAAGQTSAGVLAKLTPELEARQAEIISQTQDRAKQSLEAALDEFEQRLQASTAQAQQTASERMKAETLSKLLPELETHQTQTVGQAQERVRQTLEASLGEFERGLEIAAARVEEAATGRLTAEVLDKAAPQLEARHQTMLSQTQERAQQALAASLDEFERQLQTSASKAQEAASERLSREILDRLIPQLEARQSEAVQQTNERAKQDLSSAVKAFQEELQTVSTEARQAATGQWTAEMAAKLAPQLQARQWEAVEQTRKQINDQLHASFGEFEQRLQTAAAQTEEIAVEKLSTELLSTLAPELQACKTQTLEQTQGQVSQTLEAALGEFRQQLELAATQAQEGATEQLSAGILARLVPQLEARQAETVEEARSRIQQTLENSLSEFTPQLQAAAAQSRQAASERLTVEILSQLLPELESRQNAAVDQTQERVQETLQAGLGDFEQRLKVAAGQAQQAALEKLAEDTKIQLAPVLEAHQAEMLDRVRDQVTAEIHDGMRSLRTHVENEIAGCQKSADSLLQKPSELIRKYAEDTMAMLREEMIEQRNSAVESAKLEVRAMMRSTLTSLNEEATAFTGEFRGQIRSAWDGIKSRGLEELESLHKEATEQRRESVLQHLQKDAEDLTQVAVGQFRSHAEEAIREANDTVNKQVGAAAFLLKDWMDQATTRLERCLEKVETRAETAFEAAQARSLKTQMAMMERVHRQSEEIALELHDRFQEAASALRGGQRQIPEVAPRSGGDGGEEQKTSSSHSSLER